jgi:uncharacterized protein involved in outer membrane biogenesis
MASDVSPSRAQPLRRLVTGRPFLITAAVVVTLFLAYTLAGFVLVPRLIATYVPRYVQEQLKRRAEIGEVRVNPLLFKLEIKDFRLQEADGKPLLGFDRLFVDFELSSLFRWAWTFAEIQLDAPRVDAALARDGRLNIAQLLDSFPRSEKPPEPTAPAPPRVLLQHAVVRRGSMSFTDHSARTNPHTAALEPIDIELRDITTLPERRGPYAIAATLADGGVVGWEGEVSLVPLSSSGRLGIRGFPLATAWRFVQEDLTLTEPAGRLDSEIRYQFDYRDGVTSLRVEDVGVTVAGLVLSQRGDKTPMLALETIRLSGGRGDVIARELTVSEITVGPGRLAVTIATDGTVNWQNLAVAKPQEAAPTPAATKEERPWRLAAEKVRVEQIALGVADYSRVTPLGVDVAGLSLGLSARLEGGPAGLAGMIDGVGVTLARVAMREAATANTPVVALEQVALEGGRIDLRGHHVAVSRIGVTGGVSTLIRDPDGSMQLEGLFKVRETDKSLPLARKLIPAPAPARPAPTPAAKPWTVSLEKLELAGHRVAFSDRTVTPAVRVDLDRIKASVREVRNDGKKPFPFDASFRMVQGGRFAISGQVAPDGRAGDARLTATQLALPPAQPYVASVANVEIRSGDVSTAGRFTYRTGRDRPTITFTGSADVDRLFVVDATTGDQVVSWASVHADTVRFGLAPDRLQINELRLTELDGRVVIAADKSFNVAALVKRDSPSASPAGTANKAPKPAASPAATEANGAPEFPVSIERVRLDRSAMYFADLSLVLPFATRVHELNGVVAGLGSDPASRATVQLDGQVDEFGMLNVDGALSTFHPKVFTDIKVNFRNVPMPTLSPYSATFAGRRIQSGTMDLDLEYKIDQSALKGENRVVLQQVQLGERVEAPGVTRLPLDLAIAILSDAEGRIDLELPVRGNVDRPEFSYGHLIWQALVTVITKAVTSPFRALASLFGDENAERLQTVVFEAGSDTVTPPEQEKLKRVAEVLGKRPRLKLTVNGGYEPKVDGEALRSLHVRQDLARRLDVKVPPGQDPGPVAFDQARTQRALEALLTEHGGAKALEEFQAGYEKRTGKKAERANPLLAFVGRGSSDRAFYEAMFRQLVETAPLTDAEVTALGQRRGEAIARVLKERAGPAAERVEVGSPEAAGKAEKNAVPARLSLGVAGSS